MSFMSGTESIEQVLRRIRESRNAANNLNNINQTSELNEMNPIDTIRQTNELNHMNSTEFPNVVEGTSTVQEEETREEKKVELEQGRRNSIINEIPRVNGYVDELRAPDRRERGADTWEHNINNNEEKQNENDHISINRIIHNNENEFMNPHCKEGFQNINDPNSTMITGYSKKNVNPIDKEEVESEVSYMPSSSNAKCDTTEMRQRRKITNNENLVDSRKSSATITNTNSNLNTYNVLNDMDNLIYSDLNGTSGAVSSNNELSSRRTQGQGDTIASTNENKREGTGTNTIHDSTRRHNESRRRKPTKLEKYIYQSVVMFFMTLLPWWTPDLAYLEE